MVKSYQKAACLSLKGNIEKMIFNKYATISSSKVCQLGIQSSGDDIFLPYEVLDPLHLVLSKTTSKSSIKSYNESKER